MLLRGLLIIIVSYLFIFIPINQLSDHLYRFMRMGKYYHIEMKTPHFLCICLAFGTIFIKFQYASDFRLAESCAFFAAWFPDRGSDLLRQAILSSPVFWRFARHAFFTVKPLV